MALLPLQLMTLEPEVQHALLKSHHLKNVTEYRQGGVKDLFASFLGEAEAEVETGSVVWATETTAEGTAHEFHEAITPESLATIRPRVLKSKEEQKKRVKEKAEVFTPSWVCNLQNNLIDDEVLYPNAFNENSGSQGKTWTGTKDPIRFTEEYTWAHYVTETRLEMTCGEAPYLCSPYDTVSGDPIPVRDSNGGWARIGLLDRKLRVVSENTDSQEEWESAAMFALRATFGFEWQGDNLLLARLNFLNTYRDHYFEVWEVEPTSERMVEVARVASWNLWQMDGLKMVQPNTCSSNCRACAEKKRAGHDGQVAVIRMGGKTKTFEELLPNDMWLGRR